MKKIEAIIKPLKLNEVKEALDGLGVVGLTVSEVKGCNGSKADTEFYRGAEFRRDFLPKLKIEMVLADSLARDSFKVITNAFRNATVGDGKVFITHIEEVMAN